MTAATVDRPSAPEHFPAEERTKTDQITTTQRHEELASTIFVSSRTISRPLVPFPGFASPGRDRARGASSTSPVIVINYGDAH